MEPSLADESTFLFSELQMKDHLSQKRSKALTRDTWKCHSSRSYASVLLVLLVSVLTYWFMLHSSIHSQSASQKPSSTSTSTSTSSSISTSSSTSISTSATPSRLRRLTAPRIASFTRVDPSVYKLPHLIGESWTIATEYYSYRISFFNKITQKDNADDSNVLIGYFDGIDAGTKNIELVNGDYCEAINSYRYGEIVMTCNREKRSLAVQETTKCFYLFEIADEKFCADDESSSLSSLSSSDERNAHRVSDHYGTSSGNTNHVHNKENKTPKAGDNEMEEYTLQEETLAEKLAEKARRREAKRLKAEVSRREGGVQQSEDMEIARERAEARIIQQGDELSGPSPATSITSSSSFKSKNITLLANIAARQNRESSLDFSKNNMRLNGHEGIGPCRKNPKLCGDTTR